jgi:proteasome activator subunit 4
VGIERSAHIADRVSRLLESDILTFKVSGLRKCYPRPLLLRRSNLYHLQRLRHNCGPRPQSNLDRRLLLDLAESCVSLYAEVRRHAQSASESAAKVIIGARPTVIPPLLQAFEESLKTNDYERMKGAMYTLLYGSLSKTVGRNWNFAPSLIRSFIAASTADKPSVQKLASGAVYYVMEYGRAVEKMVIVNDTLVRSIAPDEDLLGLITQRRNKIQKKKDFAERKKAELAVELVDLAKNSHWKTASRIVAIVVNLGLRFTTIAPQSLLELATIGTVDAHPGLRGLYSGCLLAVSTFS